ncbi:hypothetical protein KKB55_17560 [Myxococcota bacterium]|nr:hypothetical protein [Myxococcota bacterium]MBU1899553.1 hypothetical protein [Myxococcota bacterium]
MEVDSTMLVKLYKFAEQHAIQLVRKLRDQIIKSEIEDSELNRLVNEIEDKAQEIKAETSQNKALVEGRIDQRLPMKAVISALLALRNALRAGVNGEPDSSPRHRAAKDLLLRHFEGGGLRSSSAEVLRLWATAILREMETEADTWAAAAVLWVRPSLEAATAALTQAINQEQAGPSPTEGRRALNQRILRMVAYVVWRYERPEGAATWASLAEAILSVNAEVGRAHR